MTPRPDNGLPPRKPRPRSTPTGLDIPAWGGRRAQDALAQVRAGGIRNSTPCVICEHPIDYSIPYPSGESCSVEHIKSRSRFPELTWDPSNWAPSHLSCNRGKGDREAQPGLGITSGL